MVVFVNGLPLAVFELKNAADQDATIWDAFSQLQTYKQQIPALFTYNALLVISDGLEARIGTVSSDKERFMPWRTIEGEAVAPPTVRSWRSFYGAYSRNGAFSTWFGTSWSSRRTPVAC